MFSGITSGISKVFSSIRGKTSLQTNTLISLVSDINICLLDADLDIELSSKITTKMRDEISSRPSMYKTSESIQKKLHEIFTHFLSKKKKISYKDYQIIIFIGPKSVGKTTTIGKLGNLIKRDNPEDSIAIMSTDYIRATGQEQLMNLTHKINAHWIKSNHEENIHLAIDKEAKKYQYILVDTPGILRNDELEFLSFIEKISIDKKKILKILVLDSLLGRGGIKSANSLSDQIGVDGVIINKIDSDSKGGAAISLCCSIESPIMYIGNGEKITDIEPFDPNGIARRILGMGDLEGLLGAVSRTISKNEEASFTSKLASGVFDMHDMFNYAQMLQKIGGASFLRGFMPKGSKEDEKEIDNLVRISRAAYCSMTKEERDNPSLLSKSSRRQRIARGSALQLRQVDELINKYNQMSLIISQMAKMKI